MWGWFEQKSPPKTNFTWALHAYYRGKTQIVSGHGYRSHKLIARTRSVWRKWGKSPLPPVRGKRENPPSEIFKKNLKMIWKFYFFGPNFKFSYRHRRSRNFYLDSVICSRKVYRFANIFPLKFPPLKIFFCLRPLIYFNNLLF